jgi:hypothetical protein
VDGDTIVIAGGERVGYIGIRPLVRRTRSLRTFRQANQDLVESPSEKICLRLTGMGACCVTSG